MRKLAANRVVQMGNASNRLAIGCIEAWQARKTCDRLSRSHVWHCERFSELALLLGTGDLPVGTKPMRRRSVRKVEQVESVALLRNCQLAQSATLPRFHSRKCPCRRRQSQTRNHGPLASYSPPEDLPDSCLPDLAYRRGSVRNQVASVLDRIACLACARSD